MLCANMTLDQTRFLSVLEDEARSNLCSQVLLTSYKTEIKSTKLQLVTSVQPFLFVCGSPLGHEGDPIPSSRIPERSWNSVGHPYTFTNLWGTINKPMIGVHANHPYPMKRTYPCNRSIPINFQVSPHHLLAILLTSHYSKICKLLYLGHCFVLVETICKYFNFFEVNRQCNEEKLIYLTYVKS